MKMLYGVSQLYHQAFDYYLEIEEKNKKKQKTKEIYPLITFILNYFKNTEIHFKTITEINLFYIYISVPKTKHIFIAYKSTPCVQ